MINMQIKITCPVLDEVGNYHFEGCCEDCDVKYMSRMTLGEVEDRFAQGRLSRDQLDAYRWVWAYLSPHDGQAHWLNQPYVTDPDVQRIARKLLMIRDYGPHAWPAILTEADLSKE